MPPSARAGIASSASRFTSLTGIAGPRHRAGCDLLQCCHLRVRQVPATPAGVTAPASSAAPCHRAGCGLSSLACDAAPCQRAGCEYLPCCNRRVRKGPAAPAGLTSPLAMRCRAIVPKVVTSVLPSVCAVSACSTSRHYTSYERFSARPSCRRRSPTARPPLRVLRRPAIVPVVIADSAAVGACVKGASSTCRTYASCVRCRAMPPCRRELPTALPSARALGGPQQQQALHLSRVTQRHTLVREVVPYRAAISARELGQQHQQNYLSCVRCGARQSCGRWSLTALP